MLSRYLETVSSCQERIQAQQATVFAEHFELWELQLVIHWLRARIRAVEGGDERSGISALSLQWHCIFGNDGDMALAPFQQKLGVATAWAKKAAPRLLPAPEQAPATPAAPQKRTADDPAWEKSSAAFAAMKEQLARGNAADGG